jgi:hypothetical protein
VGSSDRRVGAGAPSLWPSVHALRSALGPVTATESEMANSRSSLLKQSFSAVSQVN